MPEFSGPLYQDHLPPELRAQTAEERTRLLETALQPTIYPPPRPGHGTVWVMPPHDDDVWSGSWQDDGNRMSSVEGSYRRVSDWVEHQPAVAEVIFTASLGDHTDVDDAAWERALRRDPGPTPIRSCR
ncbi:hypothetical protein FHR75_004081 [Kineococcus radiotolerans]|uniref:Uncharacterized protein n=1 Tax=Kineococcus radiotolerans TaxID=131568 RepID=A0A7W4TQH6_KINRA|nr:hypothetical protein [Kineococcus radiotolerans]MBB2903239.1 hypothetical protein [Kineococcus radiotolerans]